MATRNYERLSSLSSHEHYPQVMTNQAIENGHRNGEFSHYNLFFTQMICDSLPQGSSIYHLPYAPYMEYLQHLP